LTGLPNRRFVFMTIDHDVASSLRKYQDAIKHGTPAQYADLIFSVINLDDFKKITDQYGRSAADEVLKQIGALLQGACRATDTIVRWGEEEFLIISRFSNREAARLIAERFRKLIGNADIKIGKEPIRCTCSIGFAAYPFVPSTPDSFNWEQVIAFANRSLVASKRTAPDAWVGLLTTDKGSLKDFEAGNFANLRKWIDQGELSVVTSLPASSIQW
jgi:diguanylate cyclase (GGDEF)-like protein